MADSRHSFTRNLYIAVFTGAAIIVALHVVATVLLLRAAGVALNPRALAPGLLLVTAGAIVVGWFLLRRFISLVLKPAGRAAAIAQSVSQGDLRSISEQEAQDRQQGHADAEHFCDGPAARGSWSRRSTVRRPRRRRWRRRSPRPPRK